MINSLNINISVGLTFHIVSEQKIFMGVTWGGAMARSFSDLKYDFFYSVAATRCVCWITIMYLSRNTPSENYT